MSDISAVSTVSSTYSILDVKLFIKIVTMESVQTFMNVFIRSWKSENNDSLVRILSSAPEYLQNVLQSDGERALEVILDKHNGLLRFTKTVLDMGKSQMSKFNTSLKESFVVLQYIMGSFKQVYEPYISETRDLCFKCIKSFCHIYTKKTAAETLKKLIELFVNYDLRLDEVITHYNSQYLRLYDRKDGCVFYIVLGAIAKYCPKTENMITCVNSIFYNLLDDLKKQYKPNSERQPLEINIYLECLFDMFLNFVPYAEENLKKQIYFEKLYFYVSEFSEPKKLRKGLRTKTIEFLNSYMKCFSSFIYKDYQKWHPLLYRLLEDEEKDYIISAIRTFYKIIASHLLNENNQDVFMFFKNYLLLNLCSKDLSYQCYKSRLIVYGLGELSAVYMKYFPTEINEMFQMIALRTFPFYDKQNEVDFKAITDYLQAISQILSSLPSVSIHQFNVVLDLSKQFIKRFPELQAINKHHLTAAVNKIFVNISHLEKNLQHEYVNSFCREGILWSCSHTLLIDVELQQEVENLTERPICYKNYLPLWYSLFQFNYEQEYSLFLISQTFDEFVSVLISFINKLNLNVKSEDDNFFSNTLFSMKAENETDFLFFINLVDLCVEIFENIEILLLENWIEKLLTYFIKCSYKFPMISGFYKFIEALFKKYSSSSDEISLSQSTKELIDQYLSNTFVLLSNFSGELQLSCIYLILNTPSYFIKDSISQMSSVFKIAFHIGLSDISVAFYTLNTLQTWMKSSDIQCSDDIIKDVICYTEPYLSSEEISENLIKSITGKRRKANVKNITILKDDKSLKALQKGILLFYGSLDSNILFDFVHQKSINTNASWNKKNLLKCELLFPDIRLEIYFDKLIPRIIELTKSGDRKTKNSACELLHIMIAIILGKKLMDRCFNKDLCNTILRLGCDPDDIVRNLFHLLVMQLTHYLSSNLMKNSRVPQDFIDLLFEGLTDEFDPSFRDYCGMYLKEFVEWTVKQSPESDLTNISNVRIIVRRITNCALYPSNKRRLAAAIAFNHIYTIIREDENLINTYWLEFLHAFVKSMEECDNIVIIIALDNVERVIKLKSNLFNRASYHRRKPPGFSDETLKGILVWLFINCGLVNLKCRFKCMELFENLVSLISDNESIINFIINNVNQIALKNLENDFDCITISNAKAFLRCLDIYIWIFKKGFLSFEAFAILEDSAGNRDVLSNCFSKFVSMIRNQTCATLNSSRLMETEELINLTNEIILKILELMSTILVQKEYNLKKQFWDENLYFLIICCTLHPREIGLTSKNFQIMEKLPSQLECLFLLMKKHLPELCFMKFRENLLNKVKENFIIFTEINDIINLKKDIHTLKQFLEGLHILKKCSLIDFEKECNFSINHLKEKITEIFEALKEEIMDNESCKKLDEQVKAYLQELMNLFLCDYRTDIAHLLVNLVINDCSLLNLNGSPISHGEYFLNTFKTPLLRYLLSNPATTMEVLDEFLNEHPDEIFLLIKELLIFAQRTKIRESDLLADEIINRCSSFKRLLNDLECRKTQFFNINKIAVTLKNRPTQAMKINGLPSQLYLWIMEELVRTTDMEKKLTILRHFHMCLIDDQSTSSNHELLLVFYNFRDKDSTMYLKKLESDEQERLQAVSCFQVLLNMLIATRSLIVFEALVKYAAGIYKCLFKDNIKEYLDPYLSSTDNEQALKTLELAYKIFMDLNAIQDRFDVLKHFLLPIMESSKSSVIQEFYEKNCQEMASYILKKIDFSSGNIVDRKKLIVSKLGYYNMFELMFAKFELEFVNVKDPIAKVEKSIDKILEDQSLEVRCLSAKSDEEKEITRLLHCAALNCYISVISLRDEEKFYQLIFAEDREKNQLIWERIVDCEKNYDLQQTTWMVRKDRKKLINIRRSMRNGCDSSGQSTSYTQRYDLTCLSLIEDMHAYDFNDTKILSQSKVKSDEERRLDLSFEVNEINDHECMPMITGLLLHMLNNEIVSQSQSQSSSNSSNSGELPLHLKHFCNGFSTQNNNATLFLMKIINNAKDVFLPYIQHMFQPVMNAVISYLQQKPFNQLINDTILLILQSKHEPRDASDQQLAQQLLQQLVERVPEPRNSGLYKYHLQLLESLCSLWSRHLQLPAELLGPTIAARSQLALHLLLAVVRGVSQLPEVQSELLHRPEVRKLIEETVRRDAPDESLALAVFEAFGWLLRHCPEDLVSELQFAALSSLARLHQNHPEHCSRCVCALYRACRSEPRCKPYLRFALPRSIADSHKPECLRLFLDRLPQLEPDQLSVQLTLLDLGKLLQERSPGCLGPGLRILERVAAVLPEDKLQPYLELAAELAGPGSPTEERRLALRVLGAAREQGLDGPWSRRLLEALTEPNEELQELLHGLWARQPGLPGGCAARLKVLLEKGGDARPLDLLMLELAAEGFVAKKVMCDPLTDCEFQECEMLVRPGASRRTLGSMAPLFAPSFVSQLGRVTFQPSWRPVARAKPTQAPAGPGIRRFRVGDYPDVEISQAKLVEALRQVVIRDKVFGRELALELMSGLVEYVKGSEEYEAMMGSARALLEQELEASGELAGVALEVSLRCGQVSMEPSTVGRICRKMGLDGLGILLLEEEMMSGEKRQGEDGERPPVKRMRIATSSRESWIELVGLYEALGETDTVSAIFRHQELFGREVKRAALARASSDWLAAKKSYELAIETTSGAEKEYCQNGMFECLSQLSSWAEINRKVENVLGNDYAAVWESPYRNQLLPWIFRGQLHMALEDFTDNKELTNDTFIGSFDTWIRKEEAEMRRCFGEEMSVLYLCGQKTKETAEQCLKSYLDCVKEQWMRLSPLSAKSRGTILIKLRGIHNVQAYMKTIKSVDIEAATKKLIEYWDQRSPTLNEDLADWNMHVSYRLAFAHLLHEKLTTISENSSVLNDLMSASIRQRIKISELAIKNRNNAVAKKHTFRIERILESLDHNFSNLQYDFMLTASRYKFSCGNVETNISKKCKYYISSWKIAEDIINDANADISAKINMKYHLFDLSLAMRNSLEEHPEFIDFIINSEIMLSSLETDDAEEISEALKNYSFRCLRSVCGEVGSDSEMAESYAKFGKYCYGLLRDNYYHNSNLHEEFISSILTSMSLGSLEAVQYFPCLLKPEYYQSNERAVELFISKSNNVPSWLFLSWQTQLMSHLNTPLARLVIPIVQKIINDYPNGIMYNFRLVYEALPELRENSTIRDMYQSLFGDPRIDKFFEAIHHVCQPERFLIYYLSQLSNSKETFFEAVDSLFAKIFATDSEIQGHSLQGLRYRILDEYRSKLEKLNTLDYDTGKMYLRDISTELYERMKKRLEDVNRKALHLKDYSPYLVNFSGIDLNMEVPGQYSESRKPIPRYHAKISKFDRFVQVMKSKWYPIKVSFIGNDAKTYGFLIKFGEDLRQDQRLQQVFRVTNETLSADKNCKQRYLSINTYQIVPLSTSLGLIQWVDKTKSLQEYVEFSMTNFKLIRDIVANKYQNWISKAGKSAQSNPYKEALIKYSSKDVISKMKEFSSYFEWDCLRKTFMMLSTSLECFISLRHNFITSYATMCIVHWITGVGDRHLENMLIEIKTGKCYGIDFESAFGTGIDQSVPELVPFRLTAQILGLLKPFDERALFGITMTHVLRALRKERGPMMACLDVFIHEPLDWAKYARKRLKNEDEQHIDIKWLPKTKIGNVEKKLNGIKPSRIMLEELSNMHGDKDYFSKYEVIITGEEKSIRSKIKNESLTPEDQVECLLEQAKDLNVLGRMFVGWCPFV